MNWLPILVRPSLSQLKTRPLPEKWPRNDDIFHLPRLSHRGRYHFAQVHT